MSDDRPTLELSYYERSVVAVIRLTVATLGQHDLLGVEDDQYFACGTPPCRTLKTLRRLAAGEVLW